MASTSRCPVCGAEVRLPIKRWTLKPRNSRGKTLTVTLYECFNPNCESLLMNGKRMRWRVITKIPGE